MAKLLILAAVGTAADATGAGTAVACNDTPFASGFNAIARINTKGMTGAPVIKIQGSVDEAFTTPVDLAATSGILADVFVFEVTLMPYVRANVTTAAGAGDYAAYLEA